VENEFDGKLNNLLLLLVDDDFLVNDIEIDYKNFEIYQKHKVILYLQHFLKKLDFLVMCFCCYYIFD
jgi:hypothetical protein